MSNAIHTRKWAVVPSGSGWTVTSGQRCCSWTVRSQGAGMLLVDLYEWALAHPELPDPEDAGTWPGVPGSFKTHARHMRERAVPIEARRTAVTAVEAGPWGNVLKRMERRELIVPMLENELTADEWPDEYIIRVNTKKHTPRPGYFHPSVHPLMGARELYYRMHPATRDLMVPERRLAKDHMLLSMHVAAHAIVQTKMEMAKIVRPENIEWSYVDEIHKIRGRIDFIVDHPTVGQLVVEMKGQNPYNFRTQNEVKPEWDAQGSLAAVNYGKDHYVLLLFCMGMPFEFKEFYQPVNTALVEETYAKFDYVMDCIARDTPPRHCCSPDSITMNRCPARFQCWLRPEVGS